MKKTAVLLFALSLIVLMGCNSLKYKNKSKITVYPKYEQIYDYLSDYSFSGYDEYPIKLEKSPKGWIIIFYDYDTDELIEEILIWSSASKTYKKIELPKNINNSECVLDRAYTEERHYRIHTYYGYNGWDKDIINLLENKKDLNDTLEYSLARAYSTRANNLLNNNSGFAENEGEFNLGSGKNTMNSEQLKLYKNVANKAIEHFYKVYELNPNFETIVGNIYIKYCNEFLSIYIDLVTYQNEKEANFYLKTGLYNDFYINYAKNLLNTCEPNSVLFTYGDNDTYPLLYVQALLDYRSDVLVVNLSLLSTIPYINHFRESYLNAEPLKYSYSTDFFDNKNCEFIALFSSDNSLKINEIQNNLEKSDNYPILNYKNFIIKIDKEKYINKNNLSTELTNEIVDTIKFSIEKNYIFRSSLMVLDIIAENYSQRPIYFASSCYSESYVGLDAYLQNEGLALRLVPYKLGNQLLNEPFIETSVLYKNIFEKYNWEGTNKEQTKKEKYISNYYIDPFIKLGLQFSENDDFDQADKTFNKLIELFPNKNVPFSYEMIEVIKYFYEQEKYEQGNKIANILIDNVENNIIFKDSERDRLIKQYILAEIKILAKNANQTEIVNRIEK